MVFSYTMLALIIIVGLFWTVEYHYVPGRGMPMPINETTIATTEESRLRQGNYRRGYSVAEPIKHRKHHHIKKDAKPNKRQDHNKRAVDSTTKSYRQIRQEHYRKTAGVTSPDDRWHRPDNFRREVNEATRTYEFTVDIDEVMTMKTNNCGPDDPPCFNGLISDNVGLR